jgi:hypothetical protein
VIFPAEVLPVEPACGAAVHPPIATALLLVLMAAMGFPHEPRYCSAVPSCSSAWAQIGIGWAAAAPFFRDTAQALGVLSGSTSAHPLSALVPPFSSRCSP